MTTASAFDRHLAVLLAHRVVDAYEGDLVPEFTEPEPGLVRVRVWGPAGCGEVSATGADVALSLGALADRCGARAEEVDDCRAEAAARVERQRLTDEGHEP